MAPKPTIVLIHGLWMTPLCWEHWIDRFRARGYEVIAPGWPGIDDRSPQEIRAHPEPMANKTIEEIVAHYETIIKALPTPPIIMGHSFGGLFTQILASRGLGAAAVGISPAQPSGIIALPFSTIKAGFPILSNPFDYASTVKISASEFHYCFANHTTEEESNALYERYAIPSVAHVLWQGVFGVFNKAGGTAVDFDRACRAPLLLITGSLDHVVPESIVKKEYAAYKKGEGKPVVELKVYESKSHGIVNQKGWEEVADYALAFAEKGIK